MFNRLLMREVIIDVNGKYYLDEQNLKELRTKKARILLPLVFLILIAAIILDIFLSK
jgi:membrane-anchored glycerophosphoryl diester phosphodiesterase (GDPDase)